MLYLLMETQAVNKLGGMALVQADKDFIRVDLMDQ